MCGYTQGVGVGHHNFWSIVLDNIWSKYMISRPTMIHWTPVLHSSIDDLVFLWFERKIHESEQRETAWQSLVLFRRKCQYLFFSVRIHNKISCRSFSSITQWVGGNHTGSQCFSYFLIQSGVPCTIFWQHKNKEKGDKTLFCYINIYSNPLLLKRIANILLFSRKIKADI